MSARSRLLLSLLLAGSSLAAPAAAVTDPIDSLWKAYARSGNTARQRLEGLDRIVKALRSVDQDSSKAVAGRLLREAKVADDTLMTALAYRDLGIAALLQRSDEDALPLLDSALLWYGLGQDSIYRVGAGAVLSTMAMAHKNAGRMDTAVALYFRSIAVHKKANDPQGIVYCYNGLGRVREIQGRNDSALYWYRRTAELAHRLGMDELEAAGYGNLGNVYQAMGRVGEAIDMTYRSLAISERAGSVRDVAACLTTISSLRASLGDRTEALALLRQALAKYRQVDYRQGEMTASSSMGGLFLELDRPDSAVLMLEHALALEHEAGAKDLMGRTLLDLGTAYRTMGRRGDAERTLHEALGLAAELHDASGRSLALAQLGRNALDQGNARLAVERCSAGLEAARTGSPTAEQRENHYGLYLAYKALGRTAPALDHYEAYIRDRDSLDNARAHDELTRRDLLHDFTKQQLADSMRHASERARLESAKAMATLRADQNRNRAIATGTGAVLLLGGIAAWAVTDRRRRKERFEKEAASLETSALRSQMNPHFIFNALNSINHFVQRNDQDRASAYLAKFARLMRLVLENSRHAAVPLKDDLEALRIYLELERMRMDGKFDFSITAGEGIDPESTQVPPLVVQPFVENAIWHGIAPMEGKGSIHIRLVANGDTLCWRIEDDGVGRSAAKDPAQVPAKKHSLGTAITRARLDLVRKQHGGTAGFRYTDLPQGTRVEVEMPLLRG